MGGGEGAHFGLAPAMMLEVVWTRGAESDLLDVFRGLEDFSAGRGERMMEEASALVALLRRQPLMARRWLGPVRKMILRRGMLGLFYAVEARRMVIVAVLDLRCSPQALREEIKRRLPR